MLYKIRHRPTYAVLLVTLNPNERFFARLGSLVTLDQGLEITPVFGGGFFKACLRHFLGQEDLCLHAIHNPTETPLTLTLTHGLPGDIVRLNLPKNGLVVLPGCHLAHTSGVTMGLYWLGISSWLAGQGLMGLKLTGRGRLFLGSYGGFIQSQCTKRLVIEQERLLAFSPKLRIKVNFPRGVVGDAAAGGGLSSQLTGGGSVYWQSRSVSSLGRFMRLKLR